MPKPKKTPAKKTAARPKNKTPKDNGTAVKEVPPKKMAKPNLQPARRIIKKPDPEPVVVPAAAAPVAAPSKPEPLETSRTNVVEAPPTEPATPAPEPPAETAAPERAEEQAPPQKIEKIEAPAAPTQPEAPAKPVVAAKPELSISSTESSTPKPSLFVLSPSVKKLYKKLYKRRMTRRTLMVIAAVVVLGAGGAYALLRPGQNENEANKQLVAEVSKRVVVPADETPSVTTVVDETQVNQEFLRRAKKGDKVLLYFQAGQAVVYRPSSGQVVNMGPIETPTPRVFLRGGATTADLNAVINKLRASNDFIVASRDTSPNKTYEKTIVVDVAGNRPDIAKRLAALLGASVGSLPHGESRPDADLLVIVGGDQTAQ